MKGKIVIAGIALALLTVPGFACDSLDFKAKLEEKVDETKYKADVGTNAVELSGTISELSQQYQGADPSNAEQAAQICADARAQIEQARAIEVPETMTEEHAQYEEGLQHFETAVDSYETAMDDGVLDETEKANIKVEVEEAQADIDAFAEMLDEPWLDELKDKWESGGFGTPPTT